MTSCHDHRLAASLLAGIAAVCGSAAPVRGQDRLPPLTIARAAGPITIDGDLSDPGWKGATPITDFIETKPADNIPAKIKTVAYLAYDDRYFYVAFDCYDPNPSSIRAPYADRDNISWDTDYAGIILDSRHDRRSAIEFLANPRGVQYDATQDDSSGNEDTSLDLYWDSAGKITDHGWSLEIRIPFSSLRYEKTAGPVVWGIMLYRNRTRDTRYQYFTNPLPRSSNCFVCEERDLVGFEGLPSGGHITVAPYVTATEEGRPADSSNLDSRFVNRPVRGDGGIDAKWLPNADNAVDATVNPDFSQIESDVAQISTNQRFALFYPEKRPFFLEGLDLLTTPIQAVYTRTVTSPRWGIRGTGKLDSTAYALVISEDRGGGSVVVPGAQSSTFVNQDFSSFVGIGRVRHDFGRSYASVLFTDREIEGTGYNRVLGPDFQWSPDDHNRVTGQFLYSMSRTPDLPELFSGWDGSKLSGHAAFGSWSHSTRKLDWYVEYDDYSDGLRADDGFVPQVGYRRGLGQVFYKFYPTGFFTRLTPLAVEDYTADTSANTLRQRVFPGIQFEGHKGLQGELDYIVSNERVGDKLIGRNFLSYWFQLAPSRLFGNVNVNGDWGDAIDYVDGRPGHGGDVSLSARFQLGDHLELRWNDALAWLDIDTPDHARRRLFTAGVHRLKATYNFTNRMFLRAIAQYIRTDRNPSLYSDSSVPRREAGFSGSALFAYKVNWQTVLFVGYGDNRALNDRYDLVRSDRQFFLKLSYAFQL